LNDAAHPYHVAGAKVTVGFPSYSVDLEPSRSKVEEYTRYMREKHGVKIVKSVEEGLAECDAVLIESLDGRRHLAEAKPVFEAGKPCFIDKPLAASYNEAVDIFQLARQHKTRFFTTSPLRFDANIAAIKNCDEMGDVMTCDAFSPATLNPTNPGLFWYGIHGVEILYTFMGAGCVSLNCRTNDKYHFVTGVWSDGRVASMRGTRCGADDYGATIFGSKAVFQAKMSQEIPLFATLLNQVVPFLQGGPAPVDAAESLEIMAFMQAALLSEKESREVKLSEITG
jgi:predicted dehydrogenase